MIALLVASLLWMGPETTPAPAAAHGSLLVTDGRWSGLSVVWDAPARRVLTALHVVEEMETGAIAVVLPGGARAPARIVDREPRLDLAVLEVAAALDPGPPLASARMAAGAPVWLPGCGGASCPADRGHVDAPSRAFAGSTYLAVHTPVAPGWSGRPVLDGTGALVGIVDLALRREPGTALAIPIELALARFPRD